MRTKIWNEVFAAERRLLIPVDQMVLFQGKIMSNILGFTGRQVVDYLI